VWALRSSSWQPTPLESPSIEGLQKLLGPVFLPTEKKTVGLLSKFQILKTAEIQWFSIGKLASFFVYRLVY
jgi:hypothetical protein